MRRKIKLIDGEALKLLIREGCVLVRSVPKVDLLVKVKCAFGYHVIGIIKKGVVMGNKGFYLKYKILEWGD